MWLPKLNTIFEDVSIQIQDYNDGFEIKDEKRIFYDLQEFRYDWIKNKDLDWELMLGSLLDDVSNLIQKLNDMVTSEFKIIESDSFIEPKDLNPFWSDDDDPVIVKLSQETIVEVCTSNQLKSAEKLHKDFQWLFDLRDNTQKAIYFYLEKKHRVPFKEFKRRVRKIPFNGVENELIALFYLLGETNIFHIDAATFPVLKDFKGKKIEDSERKALSEIRMKKNHFFDVLMDDFYLAPITDGKIEVKDLNLEAVGKKYYETIFQKVSNKNIENLIEIFSSLADKLEVHLETKNKNKLS